MTFPLYDFGGQGPMMHLSVANGFPPETYRPLLEPFTDRYHVVCLLPRALWNPAPPPESLTSWRDMGRDLLTGLREYGWSDVIGIGHSMGGIATMLAAIEEPQRFRGLVLLDPTLLPPTWLRVVRVMRFLGQMHRAPLAQGVRRRRRQFTSTEEAFQVWRSRPLFAAWPEETLRLYAESMTRPASDGQGVELSWAPEWEAHYYENVMADVWSEVPRLRGLLPILAIQGTDTDAFHDVSYDRFRRTLPDASMARIEGHGHLFPQSAPDETRRFIEDWLHSLPDGS